jgi:hypothetical protein
MKRASSQFERGSFCERRASVFFEEKLCVYCLLGWTNGGDSSEAVELEIQSDRWCQYALESQFMSDEL